MYTYTCMSPHIYKLIRGRPDWAFLDCSVYLAIPFCRGCEVLWLTQPGSCAYFVAVHCLEPGRYYLTTSPWPVKIWEEEFSPQNRDSGQTKTTEVFHMSAWNFAYGRCLINSSWSNVWFLVSKLFNLGKINSYVKSNLILGLLNVTVKTSWSPSLEVMSSFWCCFFPLGYLQIF